MPRMNRVDPFGELLAVEARGTFMGNRGCLHDAASQIVRSSARPQWVTCLLSFKGRQRTIMSPGQYTELFFLDEATALAAGHRPCGTCQRSRYEIFKQLWADGNREALGIEAVTIGGIDAALSKERVASVGYAALWEALIDALPDGAMLEYPDGSRSAWLKWKGRFFHWTPGGYDEVLPSLGVDRVRVITPPSFVRALEAGYWPRVHDTIDGAKPISLVPTSAPEKAPAPPKSVRLTDSEAISDEATKAEPSTDSLHRLRKTPSGKALWAYFAAILRVTGMEQGGVYPLKRFLKNFSTHEQAGRIERVEGGYRLTQQGRDYFADRYQPGNRQAVAEVDVKAFEQAIRQGGDDWVSVD